MTAITRPFLWLAGLYLTDNRLDQDHDAILLAQDPPGANAGRISTAQSITNNTFTDITNDTEFFDNDGLYPGGGVAARITIAHDGDYLCGCGATWASSGVGSRVAGISINGTVINEIASELAAVAGNYRHGAVGTLVCVTNDIIRTNVWQNSGGALNVNTRFFAVRITGPGS